MFVELTKPSACFNRIRFGCATHSAHEVLKQSRTSGSILQTGLCYLEVARSKIPQNPFISLSVNYQDNNDSELFQCDWYILQSRYDGDFLASVVIGRPCFSFIGADYKVRGLLSCMRLVLRSIGCF